MYTSYGGTNTGPQCTHPPQFTYVSNITALRNMCETFSVARKYASSLIFIKFDSYCTLPPRSAPRPPPPTARQIVGPPTWIFHRSSSSQSRDRPASMHHSYGTVHSMYSFHTRVEFDLEFRHKRDVIWVLWRGTPKGKSCFSVSVVRPYSALTDLSKLLASTLKCAIPVVCIWTNKWVCSQ